MAALNIHDLNNGKKDLDHIAEVATSNAPTTVDRLGNTKRTIAGLISSAASAVQATADGLLGSLVAKIEAAANTVLSSLGYAPPVDYVAGIKLTTRTQTVEYGGHVYAPKAAELPFTTSGTFEVAKFRLIEGVVGADLADSSGASLVGNGGETVAQSLDALQLPDYAALRAYRGPRKSVYVTGVLGTAAPSGIAGMFVRDDADTATADNGGTCFVTVAGKRFKRAGWEKLRVSMFGFKDNDDITSALNNIILPLAQHKEPVVIDGRYKISGTAAAPAITLREGMQLVSDYWQYSNPTPAKTGVLLYEGTGIAIKVENTVPASSPYAVVIDNILVRDVLGTGTIGLFADALIASRINMTTYGFDEGIQVTTGVYYGSLNARVREYRSHGVRLSGNVNFAEIDLQLNSTNTAIVAGFSIGTDAAALAANSFQPRVRVSCEQYSGRHFNIRLVRGGEIRLYAESPGLDANYSSIGVTVSRVQYTDILMYMSAKSSSDAVYVDNTIDTKIAGNVKTKGTRSLNVTNTCCGVDIAEFGGGPTLASDFTTGRRAGGKTDGNFTREAWGRKTLLPMYGSYPAGSVLRFTNPAIEGTAGSQYIEGSRAVTVGGNFGTLAGVTASGAAGATSMTIDAGVASLVTGDHIAIAGESGAFIITDIYDGNQVRLSKPLVNTFSGAAVSYYAPTTVPLRALTGT
ncbi:hypothetical protein ACSUZJ_07465 [Telluria sp. B2]